MLNDIKAKSKAILAALLSFIALVLPHPEAISSESSDVEMENITEFAYTSGPDESVEIARALTLYGAKYRAILLFAQHLAAKGLMENYGDKQMEIFCLMTEGINSNIVSQSFSESNRTYFIKVKNTATLNDFVKAEIENDVLEKQEEQLAWKQEMEPTVSPNIEPARELSRAYRYIRTRHRRIAIIYIDHLEKKYPHWGMLLIAKAKAFKAMNETEKAMDALSRACNLGNQEACNLIKQGNRSN
jgi:hypothetical protein